uniref:Methyltransferase domain-containing protein n=1 Tax=Panagrolaimus superbus TaxID=310955 RepID=A0A914XZ55_9BILA
MVLIQTPSFIPTQSIINEICMESGNISFIAPIILDSTKTNESQQLVHLAREKRLLFGDSNKEIEKWNGVKDFCQALDNLVEIQKETTLFFGKKVLEIGFSTGVPSIYALEHGAKDVTVVYSTEEALRTHIEPTMSRNNANDRVNYIFGDFDDLTTKVVTQKFDVIFAPEIVYTKQRNFEKIHKFLKSLLASDGLILISGRTYYHNCDGNMSSMIDMIKRKNQFDIIDRTSRSLLRYETAPRKIVQIMHK